MVESYITLKIIHPPTTHISPCLIATLPSLANGYIAKHSKYVDF
jgi:hypothetical protein